MTRSEFQFFLVFWIVVAYFSARPIDDTDLLTQIRLGQILLQQGIPTHEPLNGVLQGSNFLPVGWLAQILFAALYQTVGFDGIRIVRGVAYAFALLLMVRAPIGRARATELSSTLAIAVAAVAIAPSANTRPQMIAAVCFALLFRLFFCKKPFRTRAFTAFVLAIVWQNSHPSLATGVALATALSIGAFVERQDRRWELLRERLALTGILVISQICTPLGTHIFAIAKANLLISTRYVFASEWLPPWADQPFGAYLSFWVLLGVSSILALRYRQRVLPSHAVLFFSATLATLFWGRFVLFWGMLLAPLWAVWLPLPDRANKSGALSRSASAFVGAIGVALSIIGLRASPTLPTTQFPTLLVETLRQEMPAGRIYNHRSFAGILALFGNPEWSLTSDGRLYLFPPQYWINQEDEAEGRVAIDVIRKRYEPSAFFLKLPEQASLLDLLSQSSDWRVRQTTNAAALVTRR